VVARRREDPVTVRGQGKMGLEALAAPCTPHGLSPALRVQASAPVPALVPRALEPVAQVA
jgi:hypothetical protein